MVHTVASRVAAAGRGVRSAGLETLVRASARLTPSPPRDAGGPVRILVLRNNDFGDLLLTTPLFEALRRRFPDAEIVAGVGSWAHDILHGNPYVSRVASVDAPWFNKFVPNQRPTAPLAYLLGSAQVHDLARNRFDVGIDVLGSHWGALLMVRARIPLRLGVKGYAGGHTACHHTVAFDPTEHVGQTALRFAELLGATGLPPNRPQIFLSAEELAMAETAWCELSRGAERPLRLVIAPGAGLPGKRWPLEAFADLLGQLTAAIRPRVAVVGGPGDLAAGERLSKVAPGVRSFCGSQSVRRTFALIATADGAVTNSSMVLHAAAAFAKPTLTLLGPSFASVARHDAQWGYPGNLTLGRRVEEGRDDVATPEEAWHAAQQLFLSAPTRGAGVGTL